MIDSGSGVGVVGLWPHILLLRPSVLRPSAFGTWGTCDRLRAGLSRDGAIARVQHNKYAAVQLYVRCVHVAC
eukprot:scaffold15002_cov131-Isochrysis_galbana.AAC.3